MKAIKIRPFYRPLLVVLSVTILTGCSGLQPNMAYKELEQKVQYVYNATTAPIKHQGLVSALFKTVSVPGMELLKKPLVFRANYRPRFNFQVPVIMRPKLAKPGKQSEKDSRYIEQFYGL